MPGLNTGSGVVTYRGDLSILLSARLATLNQFIAPRILPFVPVMNVEDYYYKVDPGPLMVAPENNRARGTNYPEIKFSINQGTYRCKSRGMRVVIPEEDIKEHNRLQLQQMGSFITLLQMLNSHEKRVADLIFNATTWAPGTPGSSLTGHNATNEWDDHANATPIDDILYAKQALVANLGVLGTSDICAAMSWKTAHHLMMCDQIRDKIGLKYKDSSPATAVIDEAVLAAAIGVNEVIIGGAQYKSGGTDTAPTGTNFWSNEYCSVFRRATVEGGRSADPSIPSSEPVVTGLGVSFQWNAMGNVFEVYDYEDPDTKTQKTRVDQYTTEEVLVTGAAYLIGNLET